MSYGGGAGSSYYDLARQGKVYSAYAKVTAPTIFTTAAATGGPLIWNNSTAGGLQRVNVVLLAVSLGIVTASTAAAALGITGNSGQVAAPTSTTAIDALANTNIGGPAPQSNAYRIGTVTNAGGFFQPTHNIGTGAVTAEAIAPKWVPIEGGIIIPPGSWGAVSASATASTAVLHIGLLFAEIPF
jgi:hypothetical protein